MGFGWLDKAIGGRVKTIVGVLCKCVEYRALKDGWEVLIFDIQVSITASTTAKCLIIADPYQLFGSLSKKLSNTGQLLTFKIFNLLNILKHNFFNFFFN